ncbi:hypothetical protein V1517DRAFT_179381 [Lipomyces orientalis]|uniref:Uncharacterized protein n=1 Tax=Lipomyces orientalis TaxID=1233043 RepID=A0ACC3TWF0_9ASCO
MKHPKKQRKSESAATEITTQREKKCSIEIEHLIAVSDRRRKRARYQEGAIKRTWKKIRTRDPFEQSEDEQIMISFEMMASAASSHKRKNIDLNTLNSHIMSSLSGVRDSNLGNDFGEESRSLATAFRRANRWIARWYHTKELQPHGSRLSKDKSAQHSPPPTSEPEPATFSQSQQPMYDETGPQMVPMR